jgi:transcriptional regulator with XRE-family HTH domain
MSNMSKQPKGRPQAITADSRTSGRPEPSRRTWSDADLAEVRLRSALGLRVREARQKRGLSGRQLAQLAGVTSAFISQIERGQATPSISTLLRLTSALEITIGDLFDVEQPSTGAVLKREDWPVIRYDASEDVILTSDARKRLNVVWSRFPPHQSVRDIVTHGAEIEFVFVLRGRLELEVGSHRHVLDEHSSIAFDGRLPHTWSNSTAEPAEALFVVAQTQ